MNKELVKKFLTSTSINQNELTEFIVDYCKLQNKPEPTTEQLQQITMLIQKGLFNLEYAAEQAAIKLGLTVLKITKNNVVLKINVYE